MKSNIASGLGPNCVADANVLLDYYGIRFTYGNVVGILMAYLVGMTAMTYVALDWGARRRAGR